MGFPPSYPPSLLSALDPTVTAEIKRKAGWETKFSLWRSPPSDTEADKIVRTERMIRAAIDENDFLSALDLQIIVQGSYSNNTNVRGESDVDICVLMRDIYNYETANAYPGAFHVHGITHIPPTITSAGFKNALHRALVDKFDAASVSRGNKCIKVRSNTARVEADVVAANIYRLYMPPANQPVTHATPTVEGVAIHPDNGGMIVNWPLQHNEKGREKNNRTGGRFKAVVHILKSLNLEMKNAHYQPIPSFLVECLVYNCPDHCFDTNTKLYDNVHSVLVQISFLNSLLGNPDSWLEVSEYKRLFTPNQAWAVSDATRFATKASERLRGNV